MFLTSLDVVRLFFLTMEMSSCTLSFVVFPGPIDGELARTLLFVKNIPDCGFGHFKALLSLKALSLVLVFFQHNCGLLHLN